MCGLSRQVVSHGSGLSRQVSLYGLNLAELSILCLINANQSKSVLAKCNYKVKCIIRRLGVKGALNSMSGLQKQLVQ